MLGGSQEDGLDCIEQLESRTLLSSAPWGELVYSGSFFAAEPLSGGDLLVVGERSLSRLAGDGSTIWRKDTDFRIASASVNTRGDSEVIWLRAHDYVSDDLLVRVSADGQFELFPAQPTYIAGLSDGRVAYVDYGKTLRLMEADGDFQRGTNLGDILVSDIAVDGEDNIYVAGMRFGSRRLTDCSRPASS